MAASSGKPPRVLIITAAYPSEGSHMGMFLAREVDGLRARGVDVTVLHMRGRAKYLTGAWRAFWASLSRRYDLIHGQYSFGGLVALAGVFKPKVITFWGSDVLSDPFEPEKRTAKISHKISPWLARRAKECTVPFYKMADVLHSPNVHVIGQGIDFSKFRLIPQDEARRMVGLNPDPNVRYIMFCADPTWRRKGFEVAEQAVELMKAHSAPVELVVTHGLPHEQIVVYMNACDVLAVPSSLESGPYVVKEAMACNLPIVSTDVGDVSSVIGHTKGCYIAERTPEDFAAKMWRSLHEDRRTTGRQDIAHMSLERLIDRIIGVYELALKK